MFTHLDLVFLKHAETLHEKKPFNLASDEQENKN